VIVANAAASVLRFAILRAWVFRPDPPASVGDAAGGDGASEGGASGDGLRLDGIDGGQA